MSNPRPVEAVLAATNATFERLRHPRDDEAAGAPPAARASSDSVAYIRAFWPHLAQLIETDPDHLGLSFTPPDAPAGDADARIHANDIRENFLSQAPDGGKAPEHQRLGAVLSSLAVMTQVLNQASRNWARDFSDIPPRCPLRFHLEAEDYVSLRMLLPRRGEAESRPQANAATLVVGGTTTALNLCWNLLNRAPAALREITGREATRADIERVWADTRELIFRVGAGSLSAFVAFASACSSNTSAMLWDGIDDLGLTRRDDGFEWVMNGQLEARYDALLETLVDGQQGVYLGCAALFARAPALPLATAWADTAPAGEDAIVFAELVRWIGAVARRQYFSLFDHDGGA